MNLGTFLFRPWCFTGDVTAAGHAASAAQPSCLSVSEPYLYCSYQDQLGAAEGAAAAAPGGGGLNIRASWLAGQDIRGDVALGLCGIMYGTVSGDWGWSEHWGDGCKFNGTVYSIGSLWNRKWVGLCVVIPIKAQLYMVPSSLAMRQRCLFSGITPLASENMGLTLYSQ